MAQVVRYLTHPQVRIDPAVPVTQWGLSDVGRQRVAHLAASGALERTRRVICSGETKAIETAAPLATALGVAVVVREDMHENDRSATGFLPPAEFEKVADEFFEKPDHSARGWETARAAQARIVTAVNDCLEIADGDVLFVGHGAVGTLLYCHLTKQPINRAFDQCPGGGCYFSFLRGEGRPSAGWRPLEHLIMGRA